MTTTDDIKCFHLIDFLAACLIAAIIIGCLGKVADKVDRVGAKVDRIEKLLNTKGEQK